MVWSQESNPGWIGIGQALLKWLLPILKIELKATLHLHNNLGKHNFFDSIGQQTYVAQASMKWVLMKKENVELEENKLNQLEINGLKLSPYVVMVKVFQPDVTMSTAVNLEIIWNYD